MSLILDALRKLEREKESREPGVLVVGSVPWGAHTRSWRPLVLALAGTGLVALLAFVAWRPSRPPAPPVASAPPPAPRVTPVPVPTAAPPAPAIAARPTPNPPAAQREQAAGPPPPPVDAPPPTQPESAAIAAPAPAGADDLRLHAISQRDGHPVALINDRLVFEGDSFEGVKVLRIGEAEVELEVRGKRRVLRF